MKNLIIKITAILSLMLIFSCSRADENDDVLSQEEISNIILNVKDDVTGISKTYNCTLNSVNNPVIQLTDGKTYTVSTVFKGGNKDLTQEIIDERDEHFILFNFINSNVAVQRIDPDLRSDGKRLGILTKWTVNNATNGTQPQVLVTLIHDAASVDEAQNGTEWGSVTGGETDALATFGITD